MDDNTSTATEQKALADLKYEISCAIVKYKAYELGCSTEEYGQIYDSEAHEKLLNFIVKGVS